MMIKDLAYEHLSRVKEEQKLRSFSEAILKLVEIYDSTINKFSQAPMHTAYDALLNSYKVKIVVIPPK